jgi:magnesium chelatase family protein
MRISGPLMDRIDIDMQVQRVDYQKLRDMRPGETSAAVRVRVEAARARQRERFAGTAIASNADMHPAQIRKYCVLDDACQALMKTAMRQLQLTARAYHRVLKLSRTIADLAGAQEITQVHLAEALQYRPKLELM